MALLVRLGKVRTIWLVLIRVRLNEWIFGALTSSLLWNLNLHVDAEARWLCLAIVPIEFIVWLVLGISVPISADPFILDRFMSMEAILVSDLISGLLKISAWLGRWRAGTIRKFSFGQCLRILLGEFRLFPASISSGLIFVLQVVIRYWLTNLKSGLGLVMEAMTITRLVPVMTICLAGLALLVACCSLACCGLWAMTWIKVLLDLGRGLLTLIWLLIMRFPCFRRRVCMVAIT